MDEPLRRLAVMRHAKSSWKSEADSDHARPLNRRGQRSAPDVGKQLVQLGWQPEFVMSSDALRTRETIGLMADEFSGEIEIQFFNSLYLAGYNEVLQESLVVPDSVNTLMVLGHNPGWEVLVHILSGRELEMTTANCVLLECRASSWREALEKRGEWTLMEVVKPTP